MQRSELNAISEAYNKVLFSQKIDILVEQGKLTQEMQNFLIEKGFWQGISKGLFGGKGTLADAGKTIGNYAGRVAKGIGDFLVDPAKPTKKPRTAPATKTPTAPTPPPTTPSKNIADYDQVLNDLAKLLATNIRLNGNKALGASAWKAELQKYLTNSGYA